MKKLIAILSLLFLLIYTPSIGGDVVPRKFDKKKIERLRKKYPYDSKVRPKAKKNTDSKSDNNNTENQSSNRNNNQNNNRDNNEQENDLNDFRDNNQSTTPPPATTENRDNNTNRNNRRNSENSSQSSSTSSSNGGVSWYIYVIFAVVIIGIALIVLTSKSGGLVWNKSNTKINPDKNDEEETIHFHSKNILSATDQAIANEEYRKAIRLMYLSLLKKLSNKNIIAWEENKTNRDYYYEIKNKSIRNDFDDITYMYEYSWYGHVDVQKNQFAFVKAAFDKMMKKLK